MNLVSQFIHRVIINAQTEEFFVRLRKKTSVIRKFIPVGFRNKFPSLGRFIPNAAEYPTGLHFRAKTQRCSYPCL